ncbi:hypothetical protein BGZ99_004637 [Dissophora globulifera]|uniref:Cyclin-domain-containing protein n=1 Tax=Dissophora globulifera TaxID=979702 RepID=A0A9P6RJA6_9FUNG|nr:hypothetical protein BGZ99_004637 [Dissophora globulifera]
MHSPSSALTPAQFDLIHHPVNDTLLIVSDLLSNLVSRNDACYNPLRDPITLFHSRAVPRISILAYLQRILQYIPFTNEVLLNALVYLDRIGGLQGMKLGQRGTLVSMSPFSTTPMTSSPHSPSASPLAMSSSKGPDYLRPTSSMSCINPDSGLSMVPKRSREEDEFEAVAALVQSKRTRTAQPCALPNTSAVQDSFPSPATTPAIAAVETQSPTTSTNGFQINSFNIHRLLITCLMVAAKFTSDHFYSNARYAKVGGLSLLELNQLELEFLFTTKFELNVKVNELQRVGNAILQFRDQYMSPHTAAVSPQQEQQRPQVALAAAVKIQYQPQQPQLVQRIQYSIPSPSNQSPEITVPVAGHLYSPQNIPQPLQQHQQQRTQLLSPPEEKHSWAETEVQDVHVQGIDAYSRHF